MTWQRWSPASLLIVLAIVVGLTAAACGGTYKYAVYSADGIIRSAKSKYWTREHLIAAGQVTVP